jgi:hypothetical protein
VGGPKTSRPRRSPIAKGGRYAGFASGERVSHAAAVALAVGVVVGVAWRSGSGRLVLGVAMRRL